MINLTTETQIFDLLPPNPWARGILIAILGLFGWQSKGFITAWREDKRTSAHAEVDLLGMVEQVTARRMTVMEADLDRERNARQALERRVAKLERRNLQLELFIQRSNLDVPEWPSHLID